MVGDVARVACRCRDAPAFGVAFRLLFKELGTQREALDDRLRSQARLVAAWASDPRYAVDKESGTHRTTCFLRTRNGSDEPVRNVIVTLYERRASEEYPLVVVLRQGYPVLDPQTTKERGPISFETSGSSSVLTTGGPPVSMVFRDSQGYTWQRERDGILQLVARPPSLSRRRRSIMDRLDAFAKGQVDDLDT